MALKPTIFKFTVNLSDINRNRYHDLSLTVAQHPSETTERMMARLLAYCLNETDGLVFSRGLSNNDEPDLWQHSLDGRILQWIEVGEPAVERLRKASHVARQVKVYSFNSKSDVWWQQSGALIAEQGIAVYRFAWEEIRQFADLAQRTLALGMTLSENTAFIALESGSVEVSWEHLTER